MLKNLSNNANDPRIEKLNQKINEYNQLLAGSAPPNYPPLLLNLLEEIDFMANRLKIMQMDAAAMNSSEAGRLVSIIPWNGVATELARFTSVASAGFSAEINLINLTKSTETLPTQSQWLASNTNTPFYFFSKTSQQAQNIAPQLHALNLSKQESVQTNENKIEYYYKLRQFRSLLLSKLSNELSSPDDIANFRRLLSQVNNEIIMTIASVPALEQQRQEHLQFATSDCAQQFASAEFKDIQELALLLIQPQAINPGPPTQEDIREKIPGLAGFEITRLGGENNINWLLTNPETAQQFVIRLEEPHYKQAFLRRLDQSPVNEFFANDFYTSRSLLSCPYSITACEFVSGGDLYSHRKNMPADTDSNVITEQAVDKIGQLVNFCQVMLINKCIHSDLKLTNGLLNGEGKLNITDKKALEPILEARMFSKNR